jgi:hypothetical protein
MDLARQIPEMNLEERTRSCDHRAVAEALPPGVTLVEFIRFRVYDFTAKALQVTDSHWNLPEPWLPDRYAVFVLLPGRPDDVRLIAVGEAEPIDQMIELFRDGVSHPPEARSRNMVRRRPESANSENGDAAQLLRGAVFDKLLPALDGQKRLLLSPDGNLARLPFAVLPGADGRLLMDAYQISYVNTGRDVLRFGTPSSGKPGDPLIVADPEFDLDGSPSQKVPKDPVQSLGFWSWLFGRRKPQPSAPPPQSQQASPAALSSRQSRDLPDCKFHFDRLPGTRTEGETLARLLDVHPWQGRDALEGRLKRKCCSPRILHLATHGFFLEDQTHASCDEFHAVGLLGEQERLSGPLPENPLLRAGFALAGANTWLNGGTLPEEAEDGLLTAEDVTGLDLLATELVVLSACETGLGEVRVGEGVFGLQRAFMLAGARSLVMSLWAVPDEATRELMEDFYKRLLAGEGRADALRNAQLKLREQYPDPLYWGAFICQGDPTPLALVSNGA